MDQKHHFRNVVVLWLIASVILTPIVVFVLAPGIPPGNGTVQASGQVTDNTVLLGVATPVAVAVLVYFGYALVVFRERDPHTVVDGPAVRGNATPGVNRRWSAMLDDIGRERPTEWAQETLYLVVNARYQECLATSVTTNLGPDELRARLGEPILDRLAETNQAYWCQWPSHRRRPAP